MSECSRRQFVVCLSGSLALGATGQAWADLPVAFMESLDGRERAERRYPIPASDGVNIDRTSQVVLVRADGHAYAFALACPHEAAAVKWVEKDRRFQCTKHDSRYQIDGIHISGRATRNMDRFPIRRDGAVLVVTTDTTLHSDVDARGWTAAAADLSVERSSAE